MKRWTHRTAITLAAIATGAFFCQAAWFGTPGSDYSESAASEYYCANPAGTAVTTQAGLSVTNPAMALYNPIGSGKNLVLLDVGVDFTASPAAAAGLMLAYNLVPSSGVASGTLGTITGAQVAKSTGTFVAAKAQCYVAGILPATPVAFRYIGGTTGASAIGGVVLTDLTSGKVVIPPGGLVSLQTTSAASVLAHMLWREDPGN